MKKAIVVFGLMLGGMQFGSTVQAAQSAKVIVENAAVLDKPQPDGTVVGSVPKDSAIAVSNVPTNGYFKSRIPSGTIGWISGNDILTVAPAGAAASATPVPAAPPTTMATDNTPPKRPEKKKKESSYNGDHSRIMISAGMQILNNGTFPPQIPTTDSKTGFGGTLEMQFKINEMFYWAGRAEYFTSSSSQIVSTSTTQTLKFHTMPLMVGGIYVPVNEPTFRLGVGLYGGLALGTSLAVTQVSTLTSGTVTYSSSDLTFYGNLVASVAMSSAINLFVEGGYRVQSATYPVSTQLPADAFKADFGGIVGRLGIEFKL